MINKPKNKKEPKSSQIKIPQCKDKMLQTCPTDLLTCYDATKVGQ